MIDLFELDSIVSPGAKDRKDRDIIGDVVARQRRAVAAAAGGGADRCARR